MTRTATTLGCAAAAALTLAACDPRVFDDLTDDMWVDASGTPGDIPSKEYPFALAYAARPDGAGTRVLVAGNLPGALGRVTFDASGKSNALGRRVTDIFQVATTSAIDPRRPFVGSRTLVRGDGVAALGLPDEEAMTGTATGAILVVHPDTFEIVRGIVPVPGVEALGAAVAFGETDVDDAATTDGTLDLAATATTQVVLFPDVARTAAALDPVRCAIGAEVARSVLVVDLDGDGVDEIVVARGALAPDLASPAGEIVAFDGSLVQAADGAMCFDPAATPARAPKVGPLAATDGAPDLGSQLVAGDFDGDGAIDLAASSPLTDRVVVFLDAAGSASEVTVDQAGVAALDAGDLDGDGTDELIVGAPDAAVDGVAGAGLVRVLRLASDGQSFDEINTLHDIDPEKDQAFGRDVQVAPFGSGGQAALAVAANGELFTYFRVAADLPDVRGN
ncbi:MAG: VCBS repeat-containing protein [Deltaproteobacteria bacterium]|nr:MAG: VCBS repeat-containing protein [Deltaproteobacteria bacterium]